MRRNSILLLVNLSLLSLLLWGTPVRADATPVRTGATQQNKCAEQVFMGDLQYTLDGGASWQPVGYAGQAVLRSLYVCPITSPITLGQRQSVGFMADQLVMIVYASPDGNAYYVHRAHKIFALTAGQWKMIFGSLVINVGNRK